MTVQNRDRLVDQIALALEGESLLEATTPSEQRLAEARRALERVELYLGVTIEEAKEIVSKALVDLG